MNEFIVYTDGGCSGNPGPGAWAYCTEDKSYENSGYENNTTNNRMELMAVGYAIYKATELGYDKITIHTDSTYVINVFTNWINKWINDGSIEVRPNHQLILDIYDLFIGIKVEFIKVPAHSDNELNNYVDSLVKKKMYSYGRE